MPPRLSSFISTGRPAANSPESTLTSRSGRLLAIALTGGIGPCQQIHERAGRVVLRWRRRLRRFGRGRRRRGLGRRLEAIGGRDFKIGRGFGRNDGLIEIGRRRG